LSLSFFAQRFPSKHFTISNGLPSNAVYCIFKDSRGLIWIGTDAGLVKYDGFSFRTLTNKDGLAGNFIRDIEEDRNGNLWIACYGDGLSKFGGKKFTNYSTKSGLVHKEIRCLYFDRKQNLCIGTERGLSIWNGKRFMNYLTKSFDTYNRFQVMQFWEERDKLYFLSRTHGYYRINKRGDRLICDSIGKNYSQLTFIRLKNEKLYSNTGGLYSDKTSDRFPLNFIKHQKISSDIIWDFKKVGLDYFFASNGIISNMGGLFEYKNGKLKNVSENYNIDSKQVWSLYFDKRSRKLWISSLDKGFYVIDLKPKVLGFQFSNWNEFRKCTAKIIASKTSLRLISSGGKIDEKEFLDFAKVSQSNFIKIIERKTYSLEDFPVFVNRPFEIRNWKETINKIYASTNIGFFELSKNGEFISYFPIETNHFIVRKNDIILHVPNGNFVFIEKVENKWNFIELRKEKRIQPENIVDMLHFRNKSYFASDLYGLYSMKDDDIELKHHQETELKQLKIKGLCSDNTNTLFLATNDNEVLAFQEKNNQLKLKYKLDSDDFIGESILCIKYAKSILIILTNRGLNLIKGKKHIFINAEQGLKFSDYKHVFVENNKLFLVNSNGFYEVDFCSFFNDIKDKPIVSIAEISIQGEPKAKIEGRNLNLNYHENNFEIRLNKIQLYNSQKTELDFSLNKKNWSPIHGNQINFNELASGNYQLFIRQKNHFSGNLIVYPLLKITISAPFWKSGWFIALLAFLFITLFFLIYRINIRSIKAREQQKAALLKRIAETKLEALQSQMNPHFIFNSLTSIHNYIIKSDVDNALLYMDKFAKLTRHTLEFSSQMQITLLEELEYLSNFIALENMRFGNRVGVSIDVGELDTSKILIPPLLIQPLIENSFEHGFTNREKKHHLELTFSITNEQLAVQLSDDGEGFNALERKSESKAMKIIQERLQLIDPKLSDSFSFTRENNKTMVRFVLPLHMK
jgi:hypothetical protein